MADTANVPRCQICTGDHDSLHCPAICMTVNLQPLVTKTDNWADRTTHACRTCMWFVGKGGEMGRCRRHAPTMNGFPVVYVTDWCGDHKMGSK